MLRFWDVAWRNIIWSMSIPIMTVSSQSSVWFLIMKCVCKAIISDVIHFPGLWTNLLVNHGNWILQIQTDCNRWPSITFYCNKWWYSVTIFTQFQVQYHTVPINGRIRNKPKCDFFVAFYLQLPVINPSRYPDTKVFQFSVARVWHWYRNQSYDLNKINLHFSAICVHSNACQVMMYFVLWC